MAENSSMPWEEAQLASAPHSELYAMRSKAKTQEEQNQLANYEHRAYAREAVQDSILPPMAAVGLAAAIPVYQAKKVLGMTQSRSEPSLEQAKQAYIGVSEGLAASIKKPWEEASAMASQYYKTSGLEETVSKVKSMLPWEEAKQAAVPITPKADKPAISVDSIMPSLIRAESQGKHTDDKGNLTKSSAGALGITQVLPKVGAKPGYGVTPLRNQTEEEYIRFSKDYLGAMVKEFDGDYEKAVAAYNGGVGTVKAAITKYGDKWKEKVPQETKDYITKVLGKSEKTSKSVDFLGRPLPNNVTPERVANESMGKISFKDLKDKGLTTYEGFKDFEKKALEEKKAAGYKGDLKYFMREKYGNEYEIARRMLGDPITAKTLEFMSEKNPHITFSQEGLGGSESGWVYDDKGDRIFLTTGANTRTMVHETEHLNQQKDRENLGKNSPHIYNMADKGGFGDTKTPARKLFEYARKTAESKQTSEVFNAANAFDSYDEFYANLRSFSTQGLEKRSWGDTLFYKQLEKDVGVKEARTMMTDALLTLARQGKH